MFAHARCGDRVQSAHPYVDSDIVDTREFRMTKIYNEFFRPIAIEWLCCGAVFEGGPGLPHTANS